MNPFPKNFLWGSATASYQVEGGIENTDWAEGAHEGRVPVCGRACDHYRLYEQDFDLVQELGHNAHRISIEWARIEPVEGVFNEEEVAHYGRVLDALLTRGITPVVTLWHFTLPLWFSRQGGFAHKNAPDIFARYCAYVVEKLGNKSKIWLTINEPMVYSSGGYLRGQWPPFIKNPLAFLGTISSLAVAHKRAYEAIKRIRPDLSVGIAKNNIFFHSNFNPFNTCAAMFMNWFWNRRFLNKIRKHQDLIGLNYYFHKKFGDRATYEKSDMGWDIYPDGLYGVLMELKRYKKPIIITENGIADASDIQRTAFITDHVAAVRRAMDAGVDIHGYLYWSLLDNYEWAFGFEKRFGLIAINYTTLERTIRPSALQYKNIINGL